MDEETIENSVNSNDGNNKVEKLEKTTGLNLEKLEAEIRNGFRLFEFDGKEYKICLPSIKDDELLSKYKSKIAAEVLKDKDVVLKDEVIKSLRDRGVWDNEKERREKDLRERYSKCLGELFLERNKIEPDETVLTELKREKIELDIELAILTETKNYFVNTAAESRIEERLLMYKSVLCIKNIDNTPVWNNIEELENCSNKMFVNSVTSEAIYFWAGIDPSMFDSSLA